MPFATLTWDKFYIKSNLKSKTVDTFPVTWLFQTQLFLTSYHLPPWTYLDIQAEAEGTRVQPQPWSVGKPQGEALEVESIEAAIPLAPLANYAQLSMRLHVYHHQSGGSGGRTVIQNTTPGSHFVTRWYWRNYHYSITINVIQFLVLPDYE